MKKSSSAAFIWAGSWFVAAAMAVAVGCRAATVDWTVLDSDLGQKTACRIHLRDSAGKAVRAAGLPFWHDHFVMGGSEKIRLPAGNYSYVIERGPEYMPVSGALNVTGVGSQELTNRLRRIVDLSKENWWSGELHVHRPLSDVELLMRAEDLHVAPVITWWNDRNLWSKQPLPARTVVQFDGNRFYQTMGGEDERAGGALLFLNLTRPLNITGASREYPSPMKFLEEARREKGAWIDIEKPFWYDAPVWFASGMVDSVGIAHNHMQRDGVYPGEAWGRPRDKQRLADPKGNGWWTQEIYYHLLDCGLRLPPSAGSASGVLPNPVGYNRVYVHVDGELTYQNWWNGLKAGEVFVSNGPLLRVRADGHWPGHVFKHSAEEEVRIPIEVALDSRDPVSRVEIIQNGRVVKSEATSRFHGPAILGTVTFKSSGWFLVRAIADVPETFRFASTGPFYVEISGKPRRISKTSAQFFLDWVREREKQIKIEDPAQREEVLRYQRDAERFWEAKVAEANAE